MAKRYKARCSPFIVAGKLVRKYGGATDCNKWGAVAAMAVDNTCAIKASVACATRPWPPGTAAMARTAMRAARARQKVARQTLDGLAKGRERGPTRCRPFLLAAKVFRAQAPFLGSREVWEQGCAALSQVAGNVARGACGMQALAACLPLGLVRGSRVMARTAFRMGRRV